MSKERYPISEDQFQAITKFMDFIIQKHMKEEGLMLLEEKNSYRKFNV